MKLLRPHRLVGSTLNASRTRLVRLAAVTAVTAVASVLTNSVFATDWIVSGNDGKYQRVVGRDTYLANPPPDTLSVLDATHFPPKIVRTVEVENAIQGPPQAVAITPDGTLAMVAAPTRFDQATKQLSMDTFLQVVDLKKSGADAVTRIELGSHPQAIAIDRSGKLGIVTCVDGTVRTLTIDGAQVTLGDTIKISDKRLAGASFTHDGKHALVSLRDEQGAAVLNVVDGKITDSGDRVSTGVAPYAIDVSSDGHWATISNAGLAGLPNYKGKLAGDADTVTLVDVSHTPFRAVQHVTVPATPEGVALSPDGKWFAVQSMDGSNLFADNPGRRPLGKVVLFAIRNGQASKVSEVAGGEAAQGIVFTADSRHVIVQFNVERKLAFYAVSPQGKITDTGERINIDGAPSSLRSAPR